MVHQGYLTPGTNGVSRDDAVAAFGKGGALFTLTGTWMQQPPCTTPWVTTSASPR